MSGATPAVADYTSVVLVDGGRVVAPRDLVDAAATLCQTHWLKHSVSDIARRIADATHAIALLRPNEATSRADVIGHGYWRRLRPGSDICTVYFVVVADALRGQGVGRRVMLELEAAAARAGIPYVELETLPAAHPFYTRLGYAPRSALQHDWRCFDRLGAAVEDEALSAEGARAAALARLSAVVAAKGRRSAQLTGAADSEAAEGGDGTAFVAMRKQLLWQRPQAEWWHDSDADARQHLDAVRRDSQAASVTALAASFPRDKQIGPSCGLTLVAWLGRWLQQTHFDSRALFEAASAAQVTQMGEVCSNATMLSLLQQAVAGSVTPNDGDTPSWSRFCCGDALDASITVARHRVVAAPMCRLCALAELPVARLRVDALAVVSYDRGPDERPCTTKRGASAHWGLVLGHATPPGGGEPLVLITHAQKAELVWAPAALLVASNAQLDVLTMYDAATGKPHAEFDLAPLRGEAVLLEFTLS